MKNIKDCSNCIGECSVHSKRPLIYLCTDPSQTKSLKCVDCIIDDNVRSNHLIPLASIFESNNNTIFKNWPLQDDIKIISRLQEISIRKPTNILLNERIDQFVKDLRSQVDDAIENLRTDMINKSDKLWAFNESIVTKYNEVCSKEQIKSLVQDCSVDSEDINGGLKAIITKVVDNQSQNKQTIVKLLDNLSDQEKAIDFNTPEVKKFQIIEQINGIDFFPFKDLEDKAINLDKIVKKESINGLVETENENNKIKFIVNKFHICSAELFKNIDELQKIHSFILNHRDLGIVPQNDSFPPEFNKLTCEQVGGLIKNVNIDELQKVKLKQIEEKLLIQFKKTNYKESQQLQLEYVEQGQQILLKKSSFATAVSNYQLENNKVYIYRCKFNRPFNSNLIRIGLIKRSEIDTSYPNFNGEQGFSSKEQGGKKIIKGLNLASNDLHDQINQLEFRICIQSNQFYFADYPHYQNINSIKNISNKFDKNEIYHFGIYFSNPGDNWSVTFTHAFLLPDSINLKVFE